MTQIKPIFERLPPLLVLVLYVIAVSIGTFSGGLWGGLGIGGGLLLFALTWGIDGRRPQIDGTLFRLGLVFLATIALLNLHAEYPALSWIIFSREVTIVVPLCLLFSPAVQARLRHPRLFPVVIFAAVISAFALGLEFLFDAPLLHIVKGLNAAATEYNRGISYLVIFAFPLLAYLWRAGKRWEAAFVTLLILFPASLTESRTTKLAFLLGLATAVAAMVLPRVTKHGLTAILFALITFPFAVMAMFLRYPNWYAHLPQSWQHRVEIWDYMSYRIIDRPFLGWGFGSSKMMTYQQPHGDMYQWVKASAGHPHNAVLQMWVELGVAGLALGLCFAFLMLRRAALLPRDIAPFAYGAWVAALCTSLVAYSFWDDSLFALFALTGLAFALLAREKKV